MPIDREVFCSAWDRTGCNSGKSAHHASAQNSSEGPHSLWTLEVPILYDWRGLNLGRIAIGAWLGRRKKDILFKVWPRHSYGYPAVCSASILWSGKGS